MDFQKDIDNCSQVLKDGGTILYPTDTVWGLGCDATNQKAVEKLLQIKHRTAFQGLIVIVENERDIFKYTEELLNNNLTLEINQEQAEENIIDFLRSTIKPTTVIYKKGINVAPAVLNNDGSIAVRLVQDVFCKKLLEQFRKPIVSTSANIHGEPTPGFFKEISEAVKKEVDYLVEYRREDATPKQSSALVRWLGNGKIEIIRP